MMKKAECYSECPQVILYVMPKIGKNNMKNVSNCCIQIVEMNLIQKGQNRSKNFQFDPKIIQFDPKIIQFDPKCDSSGDAKNCQKEYEERKKLTMATFES